MKEFNDSKGRKVVSYLDNGVYQLIEEDNSNSELLYNRLKELFANNEAIATYGPYEFDMGLNLDNFCKRNKPEVLFLHHCWSFLKDVKSFINEYSKEAVIICEFKERYSLFMNEGICGVLVTTDAIEIHE